MLIKDNQSGGNQSEIRRKDHKRILGHGRMISNDYLVDDIKARVEDD